MEHSTPVATFGKGEDRIEIRQIRRLHGKHGKHDGHGRHRRRGEHRRRPMTYESTVPEESATTRPCAPHERPRTRRRHHRRTDLQRVREHPGVAAPDHRVGARAAALRGRLRGRLHRRHPRSHPGRRAGLPVPGDRAAPRDAGRRARRRGRRGHPRPRAPTGSSSWTATSSIRRPWYRSWWPAGERAHAGLVVASRYIKGGSRAGLAGGYRIAVSRGATWLTKTLFPRRLRGISDPMSGFFAIRRSAVTADVLKPLGYKILLELAVRARPRQVTEVPFVFQDRFAGESKSTAQEGVRFLRHLVGLRTASPVARMVVFGLIGATGFVPNLARAVGPHLRRDALPARRDRRQPVRRRLELPAHRAPLLPRPPAAPALVGPRRAGSRCSPTPTWCCASR